MYSSQNVYGSKSISEMHPLETSHCHRKILGALPSLTHCTVLGKLYGAVSTKKQTPVRGGTRLGCARWKAAPEVT